MSEIREVSFDEFKELRDNLQPGQVLSVNFVDNIESQKNDYIEEMYDEDPDMEHEPEGYSINYDYDMVSRDDGYDATYDGDPVPFDLSIAK